MERKTGIRLFLATTIGVGVMGGCSGCNGRTSGLTGGEIGEAQKKISIVEDWNAPQEPKPRCSIYEGETVKVIGTSNLYDGTPLLHIKSKNCSGFPVDDLQIRNDLGL